MPVEIGLSDGTKLVLADTNKRPDDVLDALQKHRHPVPLDAAIRFQSTRGDYLVRPEHVVYVRWVDESMPA
ncbi:MAG TPA: hypothetical protein VFA30_04890 [Gaiellaceae bacterium]|nr:hypothetical protein [Gaiellaceae bacterium]